MVRITNFKNASDEKKQIADYEVILQKQIDVNRQIGDAIEEMYRRQELNIPPAPVQTQTTEEELKDQTLQRDKAFATLKSVMKDRDAANVLYALQAEDKLVEFNRFAPQFLREIGSQTNITSTTFAQLWKRYEDKLVTSGKTGIYIGPEADEYKAELEALTQEVRATKEASLESLNNSIDKFVKEIKDLNKAFYALILKNQSKFPHSESFDIGPTKGNVVITIDGQRYVFNKLKATPNSNKFKPELSTKPLAQNKTLKQSIFIELLRKGILTRTQFEPYLNKNLQTLEQKEEKQTTKVGGGTLMGRVSHRPLKFTIGAGLVDASQRESAAFKPILTRELKPPTTPYNPLFILKKREALCYTKPNFGNYVISLKSLEKGYLHLRYPSGVNIASFPKQLISTDLKKIVHDILFNNKFDEEDYKNLDDPEQRLFDDLLSISKLNKKGNLSLYRHKKYHDQERDKSIKRFNVLKGEIIAGNDNPTVIKEMKQLLFKLMNEKHISRAEYTRVMESLFIL